MKQHFIRSKFVLVASQIYCYFNLSWQLTIPNDCNLAIIPKITITYHTIYLNNDLCISKYTNPNNQFLTVIFHEYSCILKYTYRYLWEFCGEKWPQKYTNPWYVCIINPTSDFSTIGSAHRELADCRFPTLL